MSRISTNDIGAQMRVDAAKPTLLGQDDEQRFQHKFIDQANSAYILLSFGMGALALLLPVILIVSGGYTGNYSISYYYHVNDVSRNLFVGFLWATSIFLFLYHGLSDIENWTLNAAGIFGISVAMNPMVLPQCGGASHGVSLHASSADLFFLCLAFVAVVLSKGRINYIVDVKLRRRFKRAYNAAGVAMIAMPATVAAIHFLGRRGCESHWIFWVESLGIWAFAFFWFVKTLEYRLLLGFTWHTQSDLARGP